MALEKVQNRKTLRLPQHDYTVGVYYITQTTQNRQTLFGSLVNGRVRLSPAGQMVHDTWHEIPHLCPRYQSDEFIVMPDHIHGIIRVNNAVEDLSVGVPLRGHPPSCIDSIAHAQCVISGFLSPLEREAQLFCIQHAIPTIRVLACCHDGNIPLTASQLVVTPFDSSVTTINQARAAWCNQYAMECADEIVIGYLNPEGLLAFQLSDLPKDTPVTFCET